MASHLRIISLLITTLFSTPATLPFTISISATPSILCSCLRAFALAIPFHGMLFCQINTWVVGLVPSLCSGFCLKVNLLDRPSLPMLFFFFMFIYFEKERECEQERGRERKGKRGNPQAGSTFSTEPDPGLDPTTMKSGPEQISRVRHLTHWATQGPHPSSPSKRVPHPHTDSVLLYPESPT